jgi:Flp pilus assembly protein TadD
MKRALATVCLLVTAFIAVPVARADGDSSPALAAVPANPDAEAGKAAIRAQNWQGAIDSFTKVAARDARDADAQNWLGYAYRKLGNLDMAFKHYSEALRLEPRHRGAHEYIGEAYLMKGDLPKAKEHLVALDRICFFGCEEYADLKRAIAEFEKRKK